MPISSFIIGSSWGEKPARSRLAIIAIRDGIKHGCSASPWNHSCTELMVDSREGVLQTAECRCSEGFHQSQKRECPDAQIGKM
jgi:hypothetical protein